VTTLDVLVPPVRQVMAGGRQIEVGVLRMRQVPGFAKAVANPWPLIVSGDYLAVIVEFTTETMQAVQIATGLEQAFLNDLRPDEFLDLASAVFEVNLDFFARAVLPAAQNLGAQMQKAMTSASSPASSHPGTATQTSLN
jgi:hypothetical protein